MGAACCGLAGNTGGTRKRRSTRRSKVVHSAREPLLRENEREAVSNLLRYLEGEESLSSNGQSSSNGRISTISEDHLTNLCTLAHSDNVDLQRSAALCFSEFSEKLTQPVSKELLEPLVHLLVSLDVEVQKASSHALSNFALHGPEPNKDLIIQAGALQPLIALLSVENVDVQCNACGCITTLATVEANKSEIVRSGGVGPLLALAHSRDSKVQRNAAGALLNLTHDESNRHVLVEFGGVEVFAQLLSSSDPDIQFYCAAALSNLAVHEQYRKIIIASNDNNTLPTLIRLMQSIKNKVCCQACLAIRNLASDDSNQELIVTLGGLAALAPLLKVSDSETVAAAVAALRNLSIRKGNEVKIIESGILGDLKRLVAVKESPNIQCHAAGTIRNLAAENLTRAIVEAGCVEALADPLLRANVTSEAVLSEVCAAMAVLASEEIGRVKIMSLKNGNFHITLMTLLESPYQEVRYNCAGVIGHLAINGKYHKYFFEGDVNIMNHLMRFLQSDDDNFVHIGLWILSQFSSGDTHTKTQLNQPSVVSKVKQIRTSRASIEMLDLVENTLSNLKGQTRDRTTL